MFVYSVSSVFGGGEGTEVGCAFKQREKKNIWF